jgi:hypothetical protein
MHLRANAAWRLPALLLAFVNQANAQGVLPPWPDGSTLVERFDPPTEQKALIAAPLAAPASVTGLDRAVGIGAELVRPGMPEGFDLGPSTALRISRAPGFLDSKAVPQKIISLFSVTYQGIPLSKGADVVTIIAADGTVEMRRYRNIPTTVDSMKPAVQGEQAARLARRDFYATVKTDDVSTAEPGLEIWVDPDQQGHIAWHTVVSAKNLSQPAAIEYWISALEEKILWRENALYSFEGEVTGDVLNASAFRATDMSRLGLARMDLASPAARTTTDGNGHFSLAGVGTATFTGNLSGATSVIKNAIDSTQSASATASPAAAASIYFRGTDESSRAQITAYYWINAARDFAAPLVQPSEPLLSNLPVHVNVAGSCDAKWTQDSVHPFVTFLRAGGKCPNTAYVDIVLHEFGHGVDQVNLGILNYGYSEGFGDALSILRTRQSCVGREFKGSSTCLRDAAMVVKWPLPDDAEPHTVGWTYGGFVWEFIQQLGRSMSADQAYAVATQLVFAAAKTNPSNIPKAVQASFVADDNDRNPTTCSPHQLELDAAAESRNLPRPPRCVTAPNVATSGRGR